MSCSINKAANYCLISMLGAGIAAAATPRIPFTFVENQGQADPHVRFIGTGGAFRAWFEDNGLTLQQNQSVVRISFAGSGRSRITAGAPSGAAVNYVRGNDRAQWQGGLQALNGIHYSGMWAGIEINYAAGPDGMSSEYVVAPGADTGSIRLQMSGTASITASGSLLIHGESGDVSMAAPSIYQSTGGIKTRVAGGFQMNPDGTVGFSVGNYDHAAALTISQALVSSPSPLFSGYFGGSSQDVITAVAIDSLNNIIVAGYTSSPDLPATGGFRSQYAGSVDAFVASFSPNGGSMNYCTYIGGSSRDQATGVAVDGARNVYVTGYTTSTNFPTASPSQAHLSGSRDAFVVKLSSQGNALIYSTYFGGTGVDSGSAISVDSTGAAFIVGDTTSTNLPATGFAQAHLKGAQDAFVAKLTPSGSLSFVTYLGGSGTDHGAAIHLGAVGGVFVAGYTSSTDFPTVAAWQPKSGGGQDGFVVKLTPDGKTIKFSTYLGGSGGSAGAPEEINAITVDGYNNIIVGGVTSSPNFPVTAGAMQTTYGGQTDGFISRFNVNGQLTQSTFVGGSSADAINGLVVDFHGTVYATGSTSSQDFPVQLPIQNVNNGLLDAFAVKLNPTLSKMTFGTYLGGSASDQGNAIAVDSETSIVVAGQTSSGDFPTAGSVQSSMPSTLPSFITKIAPSFTLGVAYANAGQMAFTADPWHVASYTASTLYGNATDIAVAGDWTGSGVKRIGVFRNGTWILDTNGNGVIDAADKTVTFGQAGDIPVVGDWRGTGQIALGLFRNGTFILDLSGHLSGTPTGLQDATFVFGQGGDIPVAGDWNNSGTSKIGIFRNGLWLLDWNGDHVFTSQDRNCTYGQAGDIPVVGDWDSSGTPNKIGVYRNGIWLLDYDGDGVFGTPGLTELTLGFGFAGYNPLVF